MISTIKEISIVQGFLLVLPLHHYRISSLSRSYSIHFRTNLSETLHVEDVC